MSRIGIRREDKSVWERRTPITPEAVGKLVREGIPITVQPSESRIFPDDDFRRAGATLSEDLSACSVIFGVKEVPPDLFLEGKAYVFFSHTIKAQSYNMGMLREMMDRKCHLIDYEKIVDDEGRRLVLFGYYAGLSGMIETLRAVGARLKWEGIETPLAAIRQPREYDSLGDAKSAIAEAGRKINAGDWPRELNPFVVGSAGYGNVSRGAQEIYALLEPREAAPADLETTGAAAPGMSPFVQTVFYEKDMAVPVDADRSFDLQEYYDKPELYRGDFERYLPHMDALVTAIYWEDRYPRLVTRDWLKRAWAKGKPRLRVIGDITCDIDGAVECTYKATEPGAPDYVYEPLKERHLDGVEGEGPVIMAVDILPAELPRDASYAFSEALMPLIPGIAAADFAADPDDLKIPGPIRKALIVYQGELTEDFRYLTGPAGRE